MSLNDIRQSSSPLSLSVIVRVALIGLGGVNFVFLHVSLKFLSTFPMLPHPMPYSESECVSLWQRFFFLASFFLIAFSSLSIFLHNCMKDCIMGLGFLVPLGFLVSVLLVPMTILCVVHGMCTPMFLAQVAMLLRTSFLGNFVSRLRTGSLVSFLVFRRSFPS
jgi:hypothetical protein